MTNRAITISAKSRDKKPFPIEVKVRMEAAAEMGQNRCLEGRTEPSMCHQRGSENTATPSMAKIGVVIGCHHLFAVDAQLHTVHGSDNPFSAISG